MKGIARGNPVVAIDADRIGATRSECWIERIDAQNLAEDGGEVLSLPVMLL